MSGHRPVGNFGFVVLLLLLGCSLVFTRPVIAQSIPVFTTIAIDAQNDSCVPVSPAFSSCAEACEADARGCALDLRAHVNSDAFLQRRTLHPETSANKPNIQTPMHGLFVTIYVNAQADQSVKTALANPQAAPDFAPWSIVAKYNDSPGNQPWETHMYKIPGYCPDRAVAAADGACVGGDWFFLLYRDGLQSFEWDPVNGSVPAYGKATDFCIECHAAVEETDWLWITHDLLTRERQLDRPLSFDGEHPFALDTAGQCDDVTELSAALVLDVATDPNASPDAQRMFDCFGWKSFIALNWPARINQRGKADGSVSFATPERNRVWETYKQVYETFQADNPSWTIQDINFRKAQPLPQVCEQALAMNPGVFGDRRPEAFQVLNERHQAYGNQFNTIVDQNGNQLLFNIRINEAEWEYVRRNNYADTGSYNYNGPILTGEQAQENGGPGVILPDNRTPGFTEGATEIKSAWKELCTDPQTCNPVDDPNRYYSRYAFVYTPAMRKSLGTAPETCRISHVGLVGLHVVRKTFWAPQWIWATFEHVDNVPEVDEFVDPNISPNPYSLYNPKCLIDPPSPEFCATQRPGVFGLSPQNTCCPNLQIIANSLRDPTNTAPFDSLLPGEPIPSQVTRVDDIGESAKQLNPTFQSLLAEAGSPFQYYQLISTQWAKDGRLGLNSVAPFAVVNQLCRLSEDDPGPCFTIEPRDVPGNGGRRLRNTTMETYQVSICTPNDQDIGDDPPDCTPENAAAATHQASSAGCINCHFSSGTDSSFIWADGIIAPVPLPQ